MRDLGMLLGLISLLTVLLSALIALTPGKRMHRIGVTLLACWASLGLSIYGLRVLGDPLPIELYKTWWAPLGLSLAAWAIWDVSRLSRAYGTTTLLQAAEIARGFLLSRRATDGMWAQWAADLPLPAWIKGKDGVMLVVNRNYARKYGKPVTDYAGSRDDEVWPVDVAAEFDANDARVFALGEPIIVREHTPTWSDAKHEGLFLKFPLRDQKGVIAAVGGIDMDHGR